MKLNPQQIAYVRAAFSKMEQPAHLVELLNAVSGFLYGDARMPLQLDRVTAYSFPDGDRKAKKYRSFIIPKKSGKPRTIHAPVKGLKRIQTLLNTVLQLVHQPHAAATGFVPGKSVIDNARIHAGSRFVFNIDLQDFFPSIDQARIWGRLKHPPFNLAGSKGKTSIANIIAGLCCYSIDASLRKEAGTYNHEIRDVQAEKKLRRSQRLLPLPDESTEKKAELKSYLANRAANPVCYVLPQGAPTSPTLTNIICERLDRRLTGLAKRFGLTYSRYADDITFSSSEYVYAAAGPFLKELTRIIEDQNFRINPAKTRLQKPGYRQEVTGLTVNEQPNVLPSYVKQLRCWLYLWEKHGEARAQALFLKDYFDPKRGSGRAEAPAIGNVISGKLLYLRMVKGVHNPMYQKLQARLDGLLKKAAAPILPAGVAHSCSKFFMCYHTNFERYSKVSN